MSLCKCPFVGMPWWEYHDANVPLLECHDANSLMQTQFIQKFPLFSNRFFLNAWNQNIFKTWFIIHEKSSPFWLTAPKKNWWSLLENLWMGHLLEICWSDSKDLFSQFGQAKRWHVSKAFFWKRWILWKSSILKMFIFVVLEYDNLIGVKTHCDRLGNSREGILEYKVQNLRFWKGWRTS